MAQPVTGGVKGGVNFGRIVLGEDDAGVLDYKPGLVIGAFASVRATDIFIFQPEFLYLVKGAQENLVGGDIIKTNLGFLQFPLLFRVNFVTGSVRPFVLFGPAFGFRTKADIDRTGEREVDISDETRQSSSAASSRWACSSVKVIIEGRYDHGFNDLDRNEPFEVRTRTFSILAGFDFLRFRDR